MINAMNIDRRVFDISKNEELSTYNMYTGKLLEDKKFIQHHDAIPTVEEQSHDEVIARYDNGGIDLVTVVDVPYSAEVPAYDEYEDIYVYQPLTAEEIEERYNLIVESKIAQKYSVQMELAILRQQHTKPDNYKEYYLYCEECKAAAKTLLMD